MIIQVYTGRQVSIHKNACEVEIRTHKALANGSSVSSTPATISEARSGMADSNV